MKRLELLAAVAGAVTVLVAMTDSLGAGAIAAGLVVGLAASALTAARLLTARRRALGTLARQFAVGIGVAVGGILVTVVLFAAVMFVTVHDALLASLAAVFSGLLAVVVARMIAAGVLADVRMLRDALLAVGGGKRDVRITLAGRDELAELAGAANTMIERLAAEEAARRGLVAAISHDLRTPITSVALLHDALRDDIVDPSERQAYFERIGVHLRSMSALIDDLFELARLEAGEVTWTPEPVGLAALVAETVDALAPEAGAHGVELRSEIATALPAAHASPEKLQRVLFNLVHNGIRHTPAGGTVTVRAASADGSLEIEVADTGAGIAEDDRARVFDAFFRGGHETARGTSGAGLGLAIARALVEAHGGRIWLATVERGTSVRFSVPRWAARAGSPHLR